MLTDARFHRRSNPQGLMNPRKAVVHMEQRNRRHVILNLLTEGIRQPCKAPHVHSHVEVLSLGVVGRNVFLIGRAYNLDALGALTLRRVVALLCLRIVAVHLHKLREVNVGFKFTPAAICLAGAFGLVSAANLTDRADAVVVGEVISGQSVASYVLLTIRADRVLKGNVVGGTVISVEWDRPPANATPSQLSGNYGMWFLRVGGAAPWTLLPANASNVRLPLGLACYPVQKGSLPSVSAPAGSPPADLVALELATSTEQLSSTSVQFYYSAKGLLSTPASATVSSVHARLSQSTDLQVQSVGLIGRLQQGDAAALAELPQTPEAFRKLALNLEMAAAIRNFRNPTPSAVQSLGRLATSSTAARPVVLSSADALRAIHTKDSLPFLVSLLDSSDAEIRHQGLAGLSMFVENLPVQTPEMVPAMTWLKQQGPAPYRTADTDRYSAKFGEPSGRQAEYVTFWKSWWTRMQNQLK
jgi:hypothetical protein